VALAGAQAYWESQLQRLDVPLMKMLKRQVRHFTAAAGSSSGAALTITVVFQASQPVNVRWMRLDAESQNARTMIPVAGRLSFRYKMFHPDFTQRSFPSD